MTPTELQQLRVSMGIRQDELATQAGMSKAYLSLMESGQRRISDEWAERLRAAAGVVQDRQSRRRRMATAAVQAVMDKPELVAARQKYEQFSNAGVQ